MIKSERTYYKEMRRMIRRVLKGEEPLPKDPTREDLEILTECVSRGYLLNMDSRDEVLRTADGRPHPIVDLSVVPVKGLAFLRPDRTQLKSTIAIWVSIAAMLISLFANLSAIIQNVNEILSVLAR